MLEEGGKNYGKPFYLSYIFRNKLYVLAKASTNCSGRLVRPPASAFNAIPSAIRALLEQSAGIHCRGIPASIAIIEVTLRLNLRTKVVLYAVASPETAQMLYSIVASPIRYVTYYENKISNYLSIFHPIFKFSVFLEYKCSRLFAIWDAWMRTTQSPGTVARLNSGALSAL